MAKSMLATGPIAFLAAMPVAAQPLSDSSLVDAQRMALRSTIRAGCPPARNDDEIVVCGSREAEQQRHRLPLPVARVPTSADSAGGEQRAALAADSSHCTTVGRDQQCNGGLDLIGIGFTIVRAVIEAAARRD